MITKSLADPVSLPVEASRDASTITRKESPMFTLILVVCSMLVALYVVWLCRQRLVKHIPSKETLNIFSLVALVVLLVGIGLLPDILILIASVNLMPPFLKTMLGLFAAAGIIYVGCSKRPRRRNNRRSSGLRLKLDFTPKPRPNPRRANENRSLSPWHASGLTNLTLLICYILVFSRADGSFVRSAIQGCSHEESIHCSFDGDGAVGTRRLGT